MKEVEGWAAWRKECTAPQPFASQHVEDNDSAVWNRGGRGQVLCALHPAWMARGLRESIPCYAITQFGQHIGVENVAFRGGRERTAELSILTCLKHLGGLLP